MPQGTPGFGENMVTSEGLLCPHPPIWVTVPGLNLLKGHVTWQSVELLRTQTGNATSEPLDYPSVS